MAFVYEFFYNRKILIFISFLYNDDVSKIIKGFRYNTLTHLEKKAVENKTYAEFVMLLLYLSVFVLVI